MSWETLEPTLLRLSHKQPSFLKCPKSIAMFDLDGTLVKTRSGKIYPKNSADWEWWDPSVVKTLISLCDDGHALIIITNQAGASKSDRKKLILDKIEQIFNDFINIFESSNTSKTSKKIYLEIYASLANDIYRKPNTTIFEKFIASHFSSSVSDGEHKIEDLFYVGDAAGRPDDFSDSDRKFAYNIHLMLKLCPNLGRADKITYLTPEEYFFKESPFPRTWSGFDPSEYYKEAKARQNLVIKNLLDNSNSHILNMVLMMVGPPASGKSTFSKKILEKYPDSVIVNQDKCKSIEKCIAKFSKGLFWMCNESEEPSVKIVIVDNTNPLKKTRAAYLETIKKYEKKYQKTIVTKILWMDESRPLYEHLNIYRERMSCEHTGKSVKRIPAVAYNVYYKNLENPHKSEGIAEIIPVEFVPVFTSIYSALMFLQKS